MNEAPDQIGGLEPYLIKLTFHSVVRMWYNKINYNLEGIKRCRNKKDKWIKPLRSM